MTQHRKMCFTWWACWADKLQQINDFSKYRDISGKCIAFNMNKKKNLHILCDYSYVNWNDGYVVHQPFHLLVFYASFDTSETEHAISIKSGEKMKTHTYSLSRCYCRHIFGILL